MTVTLEPMMDGLARDRMLRLAGVALPQLRAMSMGDMPAGDSMPMHHMAMDSGDANEAEVHTADEADAQYGAELDRADLDDDVAVVARAHGVLTIETGLGGNEVAVHAAPSPDEARAWADYIDAGLDLADGDTTHEHDLTVVRTGDGLLLRWPEGDENTAPEEADGVDLTEAQVPDFTQALRDMADAVDEEGPAEEPATAEEPDASAMARHRQLQLLGVEVRSFDSAKHPHYGKGVAGGKGGEFRPIAALVGDALTSWLHGGGHDSDPLAGYTQPQLRKAAEQLGLNPPKGMRLVPLKGLLMEHARGGGKFDVPNAPHAPGRKAANAAPRTEAELDHVLRHSTKPAELKAAAEEWKQVTGGKRHSWIDAYGGDYTRMAKDNKATTKTLGASAIAEHISAMGSEQEIVDALHGKNAAELRRIGKEAGIGFPSGMNEPDAMRAHIARSLTSFGAAPKPAATKAAPHSRDPWDAPDAADTLAAAFHEDWRKTRLQGDGKYEPRVKTTTDKAWIAKHGTDHVDIANTPYEDLPADWQAENKAAAEVVVKLLRDRKTFDIYDQKDRNEIGTVIHNEWLKRNEYARGGPLDVPFSQLPRAEQDKDIAQYAAARGVLDPYTVAQDKQRLADPKKYAAELGRYSGAPKIGQSPAPTAAEIAAGHKASAAKKPAKAVPSADGTPDVEHMTVPQLRAHAKANGIPLHGATKRPDILAAIKGEHPARPDTPTTAKAKTAPSVPAAVTARAYAHQLGPDDAFIWKTPDGTSHEVQIRSGRIRNITLPDGQPGLEMDVEGTGNDKNFPATTVQLGINDTVQRVDKRATAAAPHSPAGGTPVRAALAPDPTALHTLYREMVNQPYDQNLARLQSSDLTDAEAVTLAKKMRIPGTGSIKTRDAAFKRIASHVSSGTGRPEGFDPQTVTDALAGLKNETEIELKIKSFNLTAAMLRRLAREYTIAIPTDLKGRDAIQRFIAGSLARDIGRWAFRNQITAPEQRDRMLATATRALGHDITPGHDQLHHYWTRGEGLAKWAESPKPWTTLVAHLTKYVGPLKAKRFASQWVFEVFGLHTGNDLYRLEHGGKPRGKLIGPG